MKPWKGNSAFRIGYVASVGVARVRVMAMVGLTARLSITVHGSVIKGGIEGWGLGLTGAVRGRGWEGQSAVEAVPPLWSAVPPIVPQTAPILGLGLGLGLGL